MVAFTIGLITGLVCGAVAVYLAWLSGRDDRTKARLLSDAQAKAALLEQEAKKWKALEGFTPRITVAGAPPHNQFITVTDSAEFRVIEMEYLTATGLEMANQSVDRAGRSVQIPIDESKVTKVQEQGCDPNDGSFSMSFRIHIAVDGMTKPFLLPVKVALNSAVKLEPMPLGLSQKT